MSHRTRTATLHIAAILTIAVLVWAWNFLFAVLVSAEVRMRTPITVVPLERATILTTSGVRAGSRTVEHRAPRRQHDAAAPTLSATALQSMIMGHTFPISALLLGALAISLLTPLRNDTGAGGSIADARRPNR
ncbi:MAG: hypothetical protein RL417_1169 [Pseudomonadota bacterium]|jgi:hypothetical protein